jgi:hypothetical protein
MSASRMWLRSIARGALLPVGGVVVVFTVWVNLGVALVSAKTPARESIERFVLGYGTPAWSPFTWIGLAIPVIGLTGFILAAVLRGIGGTVFVLMVAVGEAVYLFAGMWVAGFVALWALPFAAFAWFSSAAMAMAVRERQEGTSFVP